jgi:hypothetical protein
MATFWVSFATDEKFLGVAIVDMDNDDADIRDVVEKTIALGCNPGDGSVQAQKIPGSKIPRWFKNRLLTKEEVGHLNAGGYIN